MCAADLRVVGVQEVDGSGAEHDGGVAVVRLPAHVALSAPGSARFEFVPALEAAQVRKGDRPAATAWRHHLEVVHVHVRHRVDATALLRRVAAIQVPTPCSTAESGEGYTPAGSRERVTCTMIDQY